jgi:hypothetical protein
LTLQDLPHAPEQVLFFEHSSEPLGEVPHAPASHWMFASHLPFTHTSGAQQSALLPQLPHVPLTHA